MGSDRTLAQARTPRRGWLQPTVLAVAATALAAGYAQFAITTTLGDVAVVFGEAASAEAVAQQVGLSASTLGVGLALIRLAGLGSLLAAASADRYGRRRVLLVVAAVGLAVTALAGASPSFWAFVALAALARPMLSGANTLVGVIAAEETSTAQRSRAMALVQASYGVGSGIVAIAHGWWDGEAFRAVFALAGVGLVAVPLLGRAIEEPPVFRSAGPATGLPGRVDRGLVPRLALIGSITAATGLVTGPALTYLFVYGENVLGAAPATMALLVLAAGPVGLVGLVVGRWAADHLGRRPAAVGATVALAVTAVGAYSGSFSALAAGYLLHIAAGGALGPAVGALLAEVFPTRARATANGWVIAVGILGSVAGLAAFGGLADAFGSFATAAAVLWTPVVPVAVLYARLPETRFVELGDDEPAGERPG